MVADVDPGYAQFVEHHELQLKSNGLPESAWRLVYAKLQPKTVQDVESGLSEQEGVTIAAKAHKAYSAVYIVEHKWSGDGGAEAYSALEDDIEQPAKLCELLGEEGGDSARDEKVDHIVAVTGCTRSTAEMFLDKTNGDLLYAVDGVNEGGVEAKAPFDEDAIRKKLNLPFDMTNPLTKEEFRSAIADDRAKSEPEVERMYNDYMLKKQQEKGDDGHGVTPNYKWEDCAEDGSIQVTIPVPPGTTTKSIISKVTSRHWTFGIRGQPPLIYGNFAGLVQPDECTWYIDKGTGNITASIQKSETESLLWTSLIQGEEKISEDYVSAERSRKIAATLNSTWYNSLTYQAVTPEGRQAHNWYLPPTLVQHMPHSAQPNFKMSPFWSCYGGKIYSLIWPVAVVNVGDVCTRDRVSVLYTGEPALQLEVRSWLMDPSNIDKPLPAWQCDTESNDYTAPQQWEYCEGTDNIEDLPALALHSDMVLTKDRVTELAALGVSLVPHEDSLHYWVEGRGSREGLKSVNSADNIMTNLIRLNHHIKSTFGAAPWWPAGYHLNKELASILSKEQSWEPYWVLRCSEGTAQSVVTSHQVRIARMCENSLNYFAQPYVYSMSLVGYQCSLEYTVVLRDQQLWVSDVPAVHKARESSQSDNHYRPDSFISRSDAGHFPSTSWGAFLVQYSSNSKDSWPVQDIKIMHVLHELLSGFAKESTGKHCYGVHVIITADFDVKIVGINPTPRYHPSTQHLASAWGLLYNGLNCVQGFRKLNV